MFERPEFNNDCVLVHVESPKNESTLVEFRELVGSTGASEVDVVQATVTRPNPRTLIGSGKVDEIAECVKSHSAGLVMFNHSLSPSQERNLEAILQCRVLDRAGLILDIFAQRARSFEGKLQVELAQLAHLSTRLVRGWTHLERQKGGIGLRGPGETQLETDRRLLAVRIKQITRRLERVNARRELGRSNRKKQEMPTISLVGYTNAGKSTLFNRLTDGAVYAADQLFATLDPTIRKISINPQETALLADTVGFINDLPHELIDAFRSTLQETREAALLLHIIDAADPDYEEKRRQVSEVLSEIGAGEVPQIQVYNKVDALDDAGREEFRTSLAALPESVLAVAVSANSGEGIEDLLSLVAQQIAPSRVSGWLTLPASKARERAWLYGCQAVQQEQIGSTGEFILRLSIREKDWQRFLKISDAGEGLVIRGL